MIEKLILLWRKHRQLAAYCIAGGCTFLVNMSLFYLMLRRFCLNENLANALSTIIAILFAYAASKLFVFRTHCHNSKDFLREMLSFFAARGLTFGIQVGGGFVLMTLLGFHEMLSELGLIILVQVLNFIFSKIFIFREKDA